MADRNMTEPERIAEEYNEARPDWFWLDGADPSVDDDLMEQWLASVLNRPGLTGPCLLATVEKLVRHLSGGKREVILCANPSEAENHSRDETSD